MYQSHIVPEYLMYDDIVDVMKNLYCLHLIAVVIDPLYMRVLQLHARDRAYVFYRKKQYFISRKNF